MPLPQNFHAFVGAAVLGAVSAAGLFLYEHFRQERQRHAMAKDLARLDQELTAVKKELNHILAKQKEKLAFLGSFFSTRQLNYFNAWNCSESKQVILNKVLPSYTIEWFSYRSGKNRKSLKESRAKTVLSSSTTLDGFTSASEVESSDLEFYDLSDEEESDALASLDVDLLRDIDNKLDGGDLVTLQNALEKLKQLSEDNPENSDILWRIAKAHHRIYEKLNESDTETRKEHVFKGVDACKNALTYDQSNGNAHKWMAVLIGAQSDYLPLKERIAISHQFREHVKSALAQFPNDASLYHMLGRLSYELAGLKWYERKVAAALFGEPPAATYEEALEYFQKAEKLSDKEWKANRLYIAKSKIVLGDIQDALNWLDQAKNITEEYESKEDVETQKLLKQYESYR